MRIGPIAHGALLIVALIFAYQTWTRDEGDKREIGNFVVWDKSDNPAVRVILEREKKTTTVERLSDDKGNGKGTYVWGSLAESKKKTKAPKPLAPTEGGENEVETAPEGVANPDDVETTTTSFPTGEVGEQLLRDVTTLKALRKLGKISDEQRTEYGFDTATDNLTVIFKDGTQETLVIGNNIYGGTDRFVVNPKNDMAYLIAKEIVQPLRTPQAMLGIKDLHAFDRKDLASISLNTEKGEQQLVTRTVKDEEGERTEWSYANASAPDVALSNFVDRTLQLGAPGSYDLDVPVEALTKIAEFKFFNNRNTEIGFLELYRQTADSEGASMKTEYWVRSASTHKLGKASKISAQRVDQDLVEHFKIEPGPDTPEGPVKEPAKIPGRTLPRKEGLPSPHGAPPPGFAPGGAPMPPGHPAPPPKGAPRSGMAPTKSAPAKTAPPAPPTQPAPKTKPKPTNQLPVQKK